MKSEDEKNFANSYNSNKSSEILMEGENEYYIDNENKKIKIKGDDLRGSNIFAYGVGHVLNDLTATCWFSFLLYYLTDIVNLDRRKAGWVMLSGQFFDGLATPLVGIFSDKYNTSLGKRTPWYVGGTVGVILCFSLIFQKCEVCQLTPKPEVAEMIYYITLPSLFNIAWASVQVAHMALLPSISINRKNRDYMVRLRTAFTFASQMLCLILSFLIFYLVEDKFKQYSYLSISCVIIGTLTSIFFLALCREVYLSKNISKYYKIMKEALLKSQNNSNSLEIMNQDSSKANLNYNTISDRSEQFVNQTPVSYGVVYWLKKPTFYKYIVIYMLVRLSINVTTSMMPYYLEYILGFKKTEFGGTPVQISLFYLFNTSGCLFNSLYLQKLFEKISLGSILNSRAIIMLISWIFTFAGIFPAIFLNSSNSYLIYGLSFIFGIGFALALSNSSSLINDVVGSKGDHGAFVYGAYSLTDKFSNGILLFVLVNYKDDEFLLKYLIPILPIVGTFLSFLIVGYKKKSTNGKKNNIKSDTSHDEENPILDNSKSLIDNSKFSFISAD